MDSTSLFRQELLDHRTDRLQGNVAIATPIAWQIIGFAMGASLIIVVLFLSFANYSRVETVPGQIVLDRGVTSIVPSRPGIVVEVRATEGELVKAGQKLAIIRAEESPIAGAMTQERIGQALAHQEAGLTDQGSYLLRAATADVARLAAQIDGDRAALPVLAAQIDDQKELVGAAELDYTNAVEVAKRGFISKRDLDARKLVILSRRQQLAEYVQKQSAKRSEIAQAQRAMVQSSQAAQAQIANTRSNRAAVSQQKAQADLARGYSLTAPIAGTVTALTAQPGQPATTDNPLMLVVPDRARPRAALYVPTTASGFIARGQMVRLSVDAFPYGTFGTIEGRIESVSQAAISHQNQNGIVPVYLVIVTIPRPWVMAFGRKQSLLAGMTLSARIVTEKRSLIRWLFAPLYAVHKR